MNTIPEEYLRALHNTTAHRFKEETVAHHGPCDVIPSLVAQLSDERSFAAYPGEAACDDETVDFIGLAGASLRALHYAYDVRIDIVIFIIEGYQRLLDPDSPTDLGDVQRGDLTREFHDNPDTDVSEVISTYVMERLPDDGCSLSCVHEAFHYTDGGVLVWDQMKVICHDGEGQGMAGRLADVFNQTFKETK